MSILRSTVTFNNVAAGTTANLPHNLNIDGRSVSPDEFSGDTDGFDISVSDTTVTVTNTGSAAATINVLCVHWHTIDRVFGNEAVKSLPGTPFQYKGGGSSSTSGNVFVFRPGAVAGGNVFTNWASLVTAISRSQGIRIIEFDASLGAVTIPASGTPYDMTDVMWVGQLGTASTTVTVADGASFLGLRHFGRALTVINQNTTTSPVTDFSGNELITIEDLSSVDCAIGAVPFFDIGTAGVTPVGFFFKDEGQVGLSVTNPVIHLSAVGNTAFLFQSNAGAQEDSISSVAGTSVIVFVESQHTILGRQPNVLGSFATVITVPGPRQTIVPGPGSTAFTATASLNFGDVALADPSGGAFTLNLPSIGSSNFINTGTTITVIETAGAVGLTLTPSGAETVNGAGGAFAVGANGKVQLVSDGVSNFIVTNLS